jgi:multiple sugar transport system permease protein
MKGFVIGKRRERTVKLLMTYAILITAFLLVIFPLLWMIRTSLTPEAEIYKVRPKLLPDKLTLDNFKQLFSSNQFHKNILNSLYISGLTTSFSIIIAILGSYSIVRLRYRSRWFFEKSIISAYLIPGGTMLIPLYVLITRLGLMGFREALVVIYPTFIVPYCAYMMIGYYKSVPYTLEEAALIDGCTRLQTIFKIVLPIVSPGIAVVATFGFTMAWNEYIWAMLLLTNPEHQTVMGAINSFRYSDFAIWGLVMAASVIATVPVVVIYMISQAMLISGKTDGGVK